MTGSNGRFMAIERWRRILRLMDEAYRDYVNEMVALRKRVMDDMRRKVKDKQRPRPVTCGVEIGSSAQATIACLPRRSWSPNCAALRTWAGR